MLLHNENGEPRTEKSKEETGNRLSRLCGACASIERHGRRGRKKREDGQENHRDIFGRPALTDTHRMHHYPARYWDYYSYLLVDNLADRPPHFSHRSV